MPESSVSLQELSLLRQQWPPAVLRHMVWLQQDLEVMCAELRMRTFTGGTPQDCMDHVRIWIWPVRVMEGSVGDLPILMIQDPADVQGEMVYDCWPPLLPVSLQMSDIGPLSALYPPGRMDRRSVVWALMQ